MPSTFTSLSLGAVSDHLRHSEHRSQGPRASTCAMSSMPIDCMIPVPRGTDSADSVRDYIPKVLTISHGLSEESARRSALEWKSGNGKQLCKMRITRLRATFGNRITRLLYQEVRTQMLEEQYAPSVPPIRKVRGAIKSSPGDTSNILADEADTDSQTCGWLLLWPSRSSSPSCTPSCEADQLASQCSSSGHWDFVW